MQRIGVTCGDPSGIGPEITVKSLNRVSYIPVILIGPSNVWEDAFNKYAEKEYELELELTPKRKYRKGEPSKSSAKIAYEAILRACELLKEKKIEAVVTAPVSKKWISLIDPSFDGHTSFIANYFGIKKYAMCGYSKIFKVVLVTEHLPLPEIFKEIKKDTIIPKIELFYEFLKKELPRAPKIGVFSLSPHAGEFSSIFDKEIEDAIKHAQKKGMDVEGPLSSDSLLYLLSQYDGFVAMYHDQAMIPAKLLSKGKGVNLTLGLPFIRTSPLHGTGFDIAHKNVASALSMTEAIKLAYKLCKKRR